MIKSAVGKWLEASKEGAKVRRFKQDRCHKVMGAFFKQVIAGVNVTRKLDKIGRHASIYFDKRKQNNAVWKCFNSIKLHAQKR
jgi:hypothetical protein